MSRASNAFNVIYVSLQLAFGYHLYRQQSSGLFFTGRFLITGTMLFLICSGQIPKPVQVADITYKEVAGISVLHSGFCVYYRSSFSAVPFNGGIPSDR
jgi:hypothetical protein